MNYDKLSTEQKVVLDQILEWLKSDNPRHGEKNYLTLGGYAGTGKTTILGILANKLRDYSFNVAFVCYTGKASQVLKTKMGSAADGFFVGTIHSLIYKPVLDEKTGAILSWTKKESIEQDLIIIDEASMVGKEIWFDLSEYGVPILAVGDHGMLPPVGEMSFNLMTEPHLKLETIHRQAEENPILKVATLARLNGIIPVEKFGNNVVKYSRGSQESSAIQRNYFRNYNADTLILCGRNRTRVAVNEQVRKELGFSGDPQIGERVICLKNMRRDQFVIYNGMVGTIMSIEDNGSLYYRAEIYFDDSDTLFKGRILKKQFNHETTFGWREAQELKLRPDELEGLFDFGYCLTVHKAQGSQANRVLLIEERNFYQTDDEWKRWLYTGVTRAVEKLHIV